MRYTTSRRYHFLPTRGKARIVLASRRSNHRTKRWWKRYLNKIERRASRM